MFGNSVHTFCNPVQVLTNKNQPNHQQPIMTIMDELNLIVSPDHLHSIGQYKYLSRYMAGCLIASEKLDNVELKVLQPKSTSTDSMAFLLEKTDQRPAVILNFMETRTAPSVTFQMPFIGRATVSDFLDIVPGRTPGNDVLVYNVFVGFAHHIMHFWEPMIAAGHDFIRKQIFPAKIDRNQLEQMYNLKPLTGVDQISQKVQKVINGQMEMSDVANGLHATLTVLDPWIRDQRDLDAIVHGLLHYERWESDQFLEIVGPQKGRPVISVRKNSDRTSPSSVRVSLKLTMGTDKDDGAGSLGNRFPALATRNLQHENQPMQLNLVYDVHGERRSATAAGGAAFVAYFRMEKKAQDQMMAYIPAKACQQNI